MPIYVYECKMCGKFEVWQKIKDESLLRCPTCLSNVTKLIAGGTGLIFNGSGFYCNDYKVNKT